jgi:hypothetical protein
MEAILPSLKKFEGTMRQFSVDDKGATALLVWGKSIYAARGNIRTAKFCTTNQGCLHSTTSKMLCLP